MILDREKLIFIHIPKNAGTSIKKLLLSEEELKNPDLLRYDDLNGNVWKHRTIYDIKKDNNKEYNSYRKFAIIRNPYDRMVSWYSYMGGYFANNDLLNTYKFNSKTNDYEIIETKRPSIVGFKDFIKDELWIKGLEAKIPRLKGLLKNQFEWVDDTVTILKHENLEEDLNNFFNKEIKLPLTNNTNHQDILTYYDQETLDIVYNKYKKDFDKYNYKKL